MRPVSQLGILEDGHDLVLAFNCQGSRRIRLRSSQQAKCVSVKGPLSSFGQYIKAVLLRSEASIGTTITGTDMDRRVVTPT